MLKRLSIFAYGIICYAVFFATFLYALGFVGNFWVPRSIDGEPRMYFSTALLIDLTLLGIFAIQHSLMARPYFKRWLTQFIPASAERSTYVLFSSVALIALFTWWEPIGGMFWDVADPMWRVVLYSLFAFGWGLVLLSTFLINHFDLFGLRQVWLHFCGRNYAALKFTTPGPYKLIRHPLYLGFFFAFWEYVLNDRGGLKTLVLAVPLNGTACADMEHES